MSKKKNKEQPEAYPIETLTGFIGRALVLALLAVFPLLIGSGRYSNVTAFKGAAYRMIFVVGALLLLGALLLNVVTRENKPPRVSRRYNSDQCVILGAGCGMPALMLLYTGSISMGAVGTIFAVLLTVMVLGLLAAGTALREDRRSLGTLIEWALLAYGLWVSLSTVFALDPTLAFLGREPRTNGLIVQLSYIALWYVISRFARADTGALSAALTGGTVFAVGCMLHNFGCDFLSIGRIIGPEYAGPFYSSVTRFMGTMGNVNLGSYVIAVMCVLAAGAYVADVRPKVNGLSFAVGGLLFAAMCVDAVGAVWETVLICAVILIVLLLKKFGSSGFMCRLLETGVPTLLCFAFLLFSELEMQTDAGYVSLGAGIVAVCVVFLSDLRRIRRMLIMLGTAAGVYVLNCAVTEPPLGAGYIWLALAAVLLCAGGVCLRRCKKELRLSARAMRVIACVLLVVIVTGVLLTALVLGRPAGESAGVMAVMNERVDVYVSWVRSENVLGQAGQLLWGNFDDSLGNNRLFTWKRVLRLSADNILLGVGPDNFNKAFTARYLDEASQVFISGGGLDKAHNEFLDILVTSGLPALLFMLAFYVLIFVRGVKNADRRPECAIFAVAVFAYCAHAFFGYQLPLHSPVMWTIIALACARPDKAEA